MLRRIVLVRHQEPLEAAWTSRTFGPAGAFVKDSVEVAGLRVDQTYHPVAVHGRSSFEREKPLALGFNYASLRAADAPSTFALRAEFEDTDAVERFRSERSTEVVGVFSDPAVTVFPAPYCNDKPVGGVTDVARKLGVSSLRKAGLKGRGVRVAIVDTGIDGSIVPVAGGWSPDSEYKPGSTRPDHGTMTAFDSRIAAPETRILDYALLRSEAGSWTAFLSDAIAAFANLLDLMRREPGPLVVNNSWGLFDRSDDAPIGSPENYSANPDHPFNQIVGTLVAGGADVFFAAGNCGGSCPDSRCGKQDIGPGASIHGANSHPDVITVAAVTVGDRRLGYSSQGPGGLYSRKPDIAAYSHFRGSGVYPVDGGTSAASPVAVGVAAAIRQRQSNKKLSPASLKGLIQRTARDLEKTGWDYNIGYGVIDADALLKALKGKTPRSS